MPSASNKPRKVVIIDPNTGLPISISGSFIGLTDTPSAYTGQAGRALIVNGTEDALEFTSITGGMDFRGGISVPADFPTLVEVQNGWFYTILADVTDNDATKTNTGQSFITGDEIVWDGSAWVVVGNQQTGHTLQNAYDGGSEMLLSAGSPIQFRDYGVALGNSNVIPGMYGEISTPGLAFAMASDNSFGPPTAAIAALAITDSTVTLSGSTIDFGFDVTVLGGNVLRQLAIPGATTNFLPLGLINLKVSDNAADEGTYTATSVANGIAPNSLVTVVDSVTQAPAAFAGTTGTASAFNQAVGLNGDETGGGARNIFIGAADGNGSGTLIGAFSDNGDYKTMQTMFNVGNLRDGMVQLINFGPALGADADKPFIQMGGANAFAQPDNGDIQFAVRLGDPTSSVSFGPSVSVTFANNAPNQDTITVAGGGLIAAGFKWNSDLVISGSASNDGQYRIESVTDTVITLADPGVLTNEAAGASVTLTNNLLANGTMWYVAGQGFRYWDGNSYQGFGGSLQSAYLGGSRITPNSAAGPVAIQLSGADYNTANSAYYLFDGSIHDGGDPNNNNSAFYEVMGGNTGAPHEIRERMVISDSSFVVRNDSITRTDIAFVDSNPDTITTVAGNFITAGFQNGDRITVSGASVPANNAIFTIQTVTANTLTLTNASAVTAEGAGANVTIKAHTKLDFGGAGIDFSAINLPASVGDYANSLLPPGFTASVGVKDAGGVTADEGTFFPVVNVSDGVGTASIVQISEPFGNQTDPNFTSASGTGVVKVGFAQVGPGGITVYGLSDLDASGSLTGYSGVLNDSGTTSFLSRIFNVGTTTVNTALFDITNQDVSGGSDVPALRIQSNSAGDFLNFGRSFGSPIFTMNDLGQSLLNKGDIALPPEVEANTADMPGFFINNSRTTDSFTNGGGFTYYGRPNNLVGGFNDVIELFPAQAVTLSGSTISFSSDLVAAGANTGTVIYLDGINDADDGQYLITNISGVGNTDAAVIDLTTFAPPTFVGASGTAIPTFATFITGNPGIGNALVARADGVNFSTAAEFSAYGGASALDLEIEDATGTGSPLRIFNAGTGDDVIGNSSLWSVTNAGVGTFAGLNLTGAVDQGILFTNGTTISQDSQFRFEDVNNQLIVGNPVSATQVNGIYGGKVYASEQASTASLGTLGIEFSPTGNDTGILRSTKTDGPANTFTDFELRMTDATFANHQIILNVDQTTAEIVFNESGHDLNFRIETDNEPNAVLLDAGTNLLTIGNAAGNGVDMQVNGTLSINTTGNIGDLIVAGNTNSNFVYADSLNEIFYLGAGGSLDQGLKVGDAAGGVVINDNGSTTTDFRVETDIETNAIFVDASANTVEIYSPGSNFEIDGTGKVTQNGLVNIGFEAQNYTPVTATPYNGTGDERFIGVNVAGAATVNLAGPIEPGQIVVVKDESGNAGTNTITINGAGANIDGAGSTTITTNYGTVRLYSDGTNWFTY